MKSREGELDDAFGDGEEEADLPGAEPEGTTDLVTVAQARNMKEAKAMKSILESAEITAFIGQGEAPEQETAVGPGIPVLVPEDMAVEAEEILAEAAMSAPSTPRPPVQASAAATGSAPRPRSTTSAPKPSASFSRAGLTSTPSTAQPLARRSCTANNPTSPKIGRASCRERV